MQKAYKNSNLIYTSFLVVSSLIISVPLLTIIGFNFVGFSDTWRHLADNVLGDYVTNSFLLMVGVSIDTLTMGVVSAWIISMFDFWGRNLLSWALLLPLALPAYIIAYTYTGMLDFTGPVQTFLREITGLQYGEYWFFGIRSLLQNIPMM